MNNQLNLEPQENAGEGGNDGGGYDTFYEYKKKKMIDECTRRGMNQQQVEAFLDHVGIPEENNWWIQNYKDVTSYYNKLKS